MILTEVLEQAPDLDQNVLRVFAKRHNQDVLDDAFQYVVCKVLALGKPPQFVSVTHARNYLTSAVKRYLCNLGTRQHVDLNIDDPGVSYQLRDITPNALEQLCEFEDITTNHALQITLQAEVYAVLCTLPPAVRRTLEIKLANPNLTWNKSLTMVLGCSPREAKGRIDSARKHFHKFAHLRAWLDLMDALPRAVLSSEDTMTM